MLVLKKLMAFYMSLAVAQTWHAGLWGMKIAGVRYACAQHTLSTQYACSMSQARQGLLQDLLINNIVCPSTLSVLTLFTLDCLSASPCAGVTQLDFLLDS